MEPYSIAPWAEEKIDAGTPAVLRALRGDFFCAPFGGNEETCRGESHPPHGECANQDWTFEGVRRESGEETLHLATSTQVRPGRIDKFLTLREEHTAIYSRHVFSGMSGPMAFGHHAMLRFPDEPDCGRVTTSRLRLGMVAPRRFGEPAQRGYSCLAPGATFTRLDRVPMAGGGFANLGRYPAQRGFEDLVQIVHEARPNFAWTAAAFPAHGYVWFALKDPRVLRSTVCWLSNGGRHYPPWNGRHLNVMGMEDVTSFFHYGLGPSATANAINRQGFPTTLVLDSACPLAINYIMAVAEIPEDFDRVKNIVPVGGGVTLVAGTGHRSFVPLDLSFLYKP